MFESIHHLWGCCLILYKKIHISSIISLKKIWLFPRPLIFCFVRIHFFMWLLRRPPALWGQGTSKKGSSTFTPPVCLLRTPIPQESSCQKSWGSVFLSQKWLSTPFPASWSERREGWKSCSCFDRAESCPQLGFPFPLHLREMGLAHIRSFT